MRPSPRPGAGPGPLYVCDLDGTLLRPDTTLSGFARETVNALVADGTAFTIASGRSSAAMRALAAGLDLRLPVIELNGVYLTDLATGGHLVAHTLGAEVAGELVEAVLSAGVQPIVTSWDGEEDHLYHGPGLGELSAWFIEEKRRYGDPRLRPCADVARIPGHERVAVITVCVPDADISAMTRRLERVSGDAAAVFAAPNIYYPGWSEICVQSPSADKGQGVRSLTRWAGFPGPVTVLGDHLNDLPMFAVADVTVAPANAHPDVLALAGTVTGPNGEDGIARHLAERRAEAGRDATRTTNRHFDE